ncbi:alpha/beta hydrolase [Streptomyces sp. NPDC058045]|uniref:alpha/beta hydrolase n=1 Tax=Streptomyces sp. NPDC058045 TaxID=3346311 RepID=UPI0036E74B77
MTDRGGRLPGGTLRLVRRTERPDAAVLLLPGGFTRSRRPARPWQAAVLRMRPMADAILDVADRGGTARPLVALVHYRYRGWNGPSADPVRDTREALRAVAAVAGPVPVVLVGHSMGGRAALRAAGLPGVRGVVALAPWCPPGEPVAQLADRYLLVLHGDRDRTTDPAASADLVRRARAAGARAGTVRMSGAGHPMLRRAPTWHRLTAEAATALLAPDPATTAPDWLRTALTSDGPVEQ